MKSLFKHYLITASLTIAGIVILFLLLPISISFQNTPDETEQEYLEPEEAVLIEAPATSTSSDEESQETKIEEEIVPVEKPLFQYIEVISSCGPYFQGDCLNIRSGPGTEFDVVRQIRNGSVLKVGGVVKRDNYTWYKVVFDEWLRYPHRVEGDWYIASDFVRVLLAEGSRNITEDDSSTSKRIVVDRSDQMLYAYDEDDLFMEQSISTGLALTPTPRGEFTVFKKTPSRYMQGPLPGISSDYYDLPGVPWNLYFTEQGAVIHGAYWHDNFGKQWSHGCVNLPLLAAEKLYRWADLGTKVIIQD